MTEAEKALKAMRVRDNAFALRDIDKAEYGEERYAALCLDAVKAHGTALEFVPKENRTPEVCLEAVKQNPNTVYFLLPRDKRGQMVNDTRHLSDNIKALTGENNFTSADASRILQMSMDKDGQGAAELVESIPATEEGIIFDGLRGSERGVSVEAYPEPEIFSQTAENAKNPAGDLTFFLDYVRSESGLRDINPADFSLEDYAALCHAAVAEHGTALRFVKPEFQTPDICLEAVKQNGDALYFVENAESRTLDVLTAAVMQQGDALRHFSDAEKTPELCLSAVRNNPQAFLHIKPEKQTPEISLAATQQNGALLQFVEKQSDAICLAAIKNTATAFAFIKNKTPEFALAAVEHNGLVLQYIKQENHTDEICLTAVKQNGLALKFVEELKQTPEIALAAVKNDADAFDFVREANRSEEVCIETVKRQPMRLVDMPDNYYVHLAAVKADGRVIGLTPSQPPELCIEAVKQNGFNLKFVQEKARLTAVCLEAVKDKGDALEFVPPPARTLEVCAAAIHQDKSALYHLFPVDMKLRNAVENSPALLEENCKAIMKAQGFDAEKTLSILKAGMTREQIQESAVVLLEKSAAAGKNLPDLLKQWEKDIGAEVKQEAKTAKQEVRQERKEAKTSLESPLDARLRTILPTEDFYRHPDNALKEKYYLEHLRKAHEADFHPPVISIGGDVAKVGAYSETIKKEDILNPFSKKDIEKMKAAAQVGVVFANPAEKEKQLAFMQAYLPEVHKIIMETLRKQEQTAPLIVGDTRTVKQEQSLEKTRGRSAGYGYGR
jgi:uncharacterized membrane protein